MQRLQKTLPEHGQLLALACLAGHAFSCAPSAFDGLTSETTREPETCAESKCLDGGSSVREGGLSDSPGAVPAPAEPDVASEDTSVEQSEAAAQDAAVEEPTADVGADDEDAAQDASMQTSDSEVLEPPACDGNAPACQANEIDLKIEPCGNCSSGTRSRARTCAPDGCSWGGWGGWSNCADEHTECDPKGTAQTKTVSCTTCGAKTQSRRCSQTTCTWEPWTDTSACSWCDACSEVVYCDTPANIADRGTWCRQKACTRPQALGNCLEDVESVCGETTQPFLMEYL